MGEMREENRAFVSIDPGLRRYCPKLRIACIHGTVRVSQSSAQFDQIMNARVAELSQNLSLAAIASNPEINTTREAYRRLGKDPSRYRGSAEALLRRITTGKGLYRINNLVDINNLMSLESFTPVGTYDLARISGRVVFRAGKAGESYKGIGKNVINIADLPVFVDDTGPFGSPTSDSEQAMITERTEQFAMMIISFSGAASLPHWAERAVELVRNHASGDNLILEIVE